MPELTPDELEANFAQLDADNAQEANGNLEAAEKPLPPRTNNTSLDELGMEEPIFDGGPTRAEVEAYKASYPHSKLLCVLLEDGYGVLYRTLTRTEWKVIQKALLALKTDEPEKREEYVFAQIVLSPDVSTPEIIGNLPAGIVPTVMTQFYGQSGFTAVVQSLQL